MRIAIFSESFRPIVNGVSVSVDTLARELISLGHEPHVFAPRVRGHVDREPYPVYRFPAGRSPGAPEYPFAYPFSRRLARVLRDLRPEVIHTQSPFPLGWAGSYWSRRLGAPLVTTMHTIYAEYVHYARWVPVPVSRRAMVALTRLYCNRARAVIVPTPPVKELLVGYGVERPITVVPTGVPLERFAEADPAGIRERHGIAPSAPLLLYAGRIAREKNLEVLLETFRRVREEQPDSRLLMVGGGPELEATRARAESLRLADSVVFTGFQTAEETRRYYRAADLFLYPSVTDTQGLVLCEALAAGLPCVAADRYGSKAVVRDGVDGFRVAPRAEDLAEAALRLVKDAGLRARMSASAREGAERFSTRAAVTRVLAVYHEALGTPSRSEPVAATE